MEKENKIEGREGRANAKHRNIEIKREKIERYR